MKIPKNNHIKTWFKYKNFHNFEVCGYFVGVRFEIRNSFSIQLIVKFQTGFGEELTYTARNCAATTLFFKGLTIKMEETVSYVAWSSNSVRSCKKSCQSVKAFGGNR